MNQFLNEALVTLRAEPNNVIMGFFSDVNIQKIQNDLKKNVKKQINVEIDDQSCREIYVAMIYVYKTYGKNSLQKEREEIIKLNDITVIYNGVTQFKTSNRFFKNKLLNLQEDYILYVGDRRQHKNLFYTIDLVKKYNETYNKNFNLIIAGSTSYKNYNVQVTCYKKQVTGYKLQVTDYKLQITITITEYKLQITSYKL